jgi:hypothetical protein
MMNVMNRKRDYISEIEEIKGRTGPDEWDNGLTKLLFLNTHLSMHAGELETAEELGFFPVAAIAAMEVYFRWEIRRLVDSGDSRYVNNLRIDQFPIRLEHDLLVALQGKRVTVGEIVAHAISLSGLDSIQKAMSQLLDCDFLTTVLKEARDLEKRRELGDAAPKILQSPDQTFANVAWTFKVRNIVCHEAHLRQVLSPDDARRMCSSCYEFTLASHYGIAYHYNPKVSLTLEQSINETKESVKQLDADLRSIEGRIKACLAAPVFQKTFDEMQEAWRVFVQREAAFSGCQEMNGTRGYLNELRSEKYAHQDRIAKLNEYVQKIERPDEMDLSRFPR